VQEGTLAATTYLMVDFMKTGQAFAETNGTQRTRFSINAGVRYAHFERDIEAPVNQTTRLRYFGSRTDTDTHAQHRDKLPPSSYLVGLRSDREGLLGSQPSTLLRT